MADMHPEGWTVGSTVYVVFNQSYHGHNHEATIAKIGRRWITLDDGRKPLRFDAETMELDGGQYSSPGRIWPSEEQYQDSLEVQKAWRELVSRLPYNAPAGMSVEAVRQVEAIVWGEKNG